MDSTCKFHFEANDDFNVSSKNMKDWISAQEFRADQIIAISSGLQDLQTEQHMHVCFYRSASMSNEPPLLLDFDNGKQNADWEDSLDQAEEFSKDNRLIAIGHTPIRGLSLQTLWFEKLSSSNSTKTHDIKGFFDQDSNGDYKTLCTKAAKWLEEHILPHQLTSISLFENEHDPNTKDFYFTVVHTAGAEPKPLRESHPDCVEGNKYDVTFAAAGENGQWRDVFADAAEKINQKGATEGHLASISNFSFGEDRKVAVVISWQRNQESILADQSRPDQCCSIF